MAEYMNWQKVDGLPFDPWLRVHIKAGGTVAGICNRSMDISGTVSDWEKWTDFQFPGTGDYVIDEALVPININKEEDIGSYSEPNVWITHSTE